MTTRAREVVAALAGIAVMVGVNAIGAYGLRFADLQEAVAEGVTRSYFSFYDGCVVLLTLPVPAFLGGLIVASIARENALRVSMAAFGIAALAALWRPFWVVPLVSPMAVHNGMVHYMLHSPLALLAFGTFGAWLGGEFAAGRFKLNDREPVFVPGSDD